MVSFVGFDTTHWLWSRAAVLSGDSTRAQPRHGRGPRRGELDSVRSFLWKTVELPDKESVHLIVKSNDDRRRHSGLVCHVWQGPVRGTYRRLSDEVFVSSPEACWRQMAAVFDLIDLTRFGYELCGSYRPVSSMGFDWDKRLPLSTRKRLADYLAQTPGTSGCAVAKKALGCVVDGAASHRETAVAMLLCLPRSCGGYGFPRPLMNAKISLGQGGCRLTSRSYFVADLLWSEQKVCVEYDSDAFHGTRQRAVMDSGKRNALLALGYRVLTLTNDQVKDVRRFDEAARALAKLLGFRLRIRDAMWESRRAALRRRLL